MTSSESASLKSGKTPGPTTKRGVKPTAKRSEIPESTVIPPSRSIFDSSYAPEGAERRKAWSRLDAKKR